MPESSNLGLVALGALVILVIVAVVVLARRRPAPPLPTAAPEAVPFLEREGEGEGPRMFALNKPVIMVGRADDSDVFISADWPGGLTVSRRHAQIRREDADFIVEDLESQNGIRVNGLATHRNLLRDGYRVSFGSLEFTVHGSRSADWDRGDL